MNNAKSSSPSLLQYSWEQVIVVVGPVKCQCFTGVLPVFVLDSVQVFYRKNLADWTENMFYLTIKSSSIAYEAVCLVQGSYFNSTHSQAMTANRQEISRYRFFFCIHCIIPVKYMASLIAAESNNQSTSIFLGFLADKVRRDRQLLVRLGSYARRRSDHQFYTYYMISFMGRNWVCK